MSVASIADSLSSFPPNRDSSVEWFMALEQIDKFQCMAVISGPTKMSQNIAQRRGENHGLSKVNHHHAMGPGSTGSHEVTVQNQALHVQCHEAGGVGDLEPKRPMAANSMTVAQHMSSQKFEIFAPRRPSVDADRVEEAISNLFTTLADPEETGSLLTLREETGSNIPSRFHVDSTSPLLLWMSQVSNDNIPMSERLEKLKCKSRRLEKL
jgi:hypothetical protein